MDKACSKCSAVKPLEDFAPRRAGRDGRRGVCRTCTNAQAIERRSLDPDRHTLIQLRYKTRHPDRIKARRQKYTAKNREKITQWSRDLSQSRPEVYQARYRIKNAVRSGEVPKPEFCSECESNRQVQAHHTDYSRPLDVVWLCHDCHMDEHFPDRADLRNLLVA